MSGDIAAMSAENFEFLGRIADVAGGTRMSAEIWKMSGEILDFPERSAPPRLRIGRGGFESASGDPFHGHPAEGVLRRQENQASDAENQEQRPHVRGGRDRHPQAGAKGEPGREAERTLRQQRQDRGGHDVASNVRDIATPARRRRPAWTLAAAVLAHRRSPAAQHVEAAVSAAFAG